MNSPHLFVEQGFVQQEKFVGWPDPIWPALAFRAGPFRDASCGLRVAEDAGRRKEGRAQSAEEAAGGGPSSKGSSPFGRIALSGLARFASAGRKVLWVAPLPLRMTAVRTQRDPRVNGIRRLPEMLSRRYLAGRRSADRRLQNGRAGQKEPGGCVNWVSSHHSALAHRQLARCLNFLREILLQCSMLKNLPVCTINELNPQS